MLLARLGIRTQTMGTLATFIMAFGMLSYGQDLLPSPIDSTHNPPTEVATTAQENAAAKNVIMGWMVKNLGSKMAMKDPMQEFAMTSLFKDNTNQWNSQLTQMFNGIPVRRGHLQINVVEGAADASHWSGQYLNDPEVDTTPALSQQKAIEIAKKKLKQMLKQKGGEIEDSADVDNGAATAGNSNRPDSSLLVDSGKLPVATAALEIHPGDGRGKRKLTYHVVVRGHSAQGEVQLHAWVDQNGNIVEAYDNDQAVCVDGLGATLYQGYQGLFSGFFYGFGSYFKMFPAFGGYVLNDTCTRWGTFDNYNTVSSTYQAFSPSVIFGNLATSDRESTNADVALASRQTYTFEFYVLGRNGPDSFGGPGYYGSVDGLGPLVSARNHVMTNWVNARWDGSATNFGDGDNVTSGPLTSLDIVAHEWQHAVTQYTANLVYADESGAVNESFSDIMGAMTERYWYGETPYYVCGLNTWKMGELAWTPGNGNCDALRYFYSPESGNQPRFYQNRQIGGLDNGGVHTNSGISNYAFYIISKGGCGYFCMTAYPSGIGASAATNIFWRAERVYMGPFDGFAELRQKTIWAAGDNYGRGSLVWAQVRDAWDAVGVPKMCTFNFFGLCLSYGD
ncbi:MAG: hypothetical protein DMG64_15720 [Acidobacteria bacterium]|nr:MAG: hypothetical protein DMG64_15720 [Acidobacteriota bacterium]